MTVELTHQYIETNGIKLHVVTAGNPSDEPVMLLHGFPEFWYCWHHQIDYLAQNGYYVIAPDQRGFNRSDKPIGVDNYHIDLVAQDITGLMEAMGYQQMYLAGHDWGGAVAWWIATHYPQYLKKLAILNAPHVNNLTDLREFHLSQIIKSLYIFFFQFPDIPEWVLTNTDSLRESLVGNRDDTFTEEDYAMYQQAWSQPNAITSTLNWYRAAFRLFGQSLPEDGSINVPIRIVWGEDDNYLGKPIAERGKRLGSNVELYYIPGATHWITHDEPEMVNHHLSGFFQ